MEAGCGWLPTWLHRIDEQLELAGAAEFPERTMSARAYFERNCWITTECEAPALLSGEAIATGTQSPRSGIGIDVLRCLDIPAAATPRSLP